MKLEKNRDYVIYTGLFLASWSLVLLILLAWNIKSSYDTLEDIALYRLRSSFSEVMDAQEWSFRHGGVLHFGTNGASSISNATTGGMTSDSASSPTTGENYEQVFSPRNSYVKVRIISQESDKLGFSPDPWENKALGSFEEGDEEAFLMTDDNQGKTVFRYAAPLKVDYSCMACHRDENFLLRKTYGAVSISTSAEPLIRLRAAEGRLHLIGYGIIWLLGCGGIVIGMKKLMINNEQRVRQEKFVGVMEMAGAAAHELNQPLQVISSCTDIMLAAIRPDDEYFVQIGGQVKESVNRLASITRKINRITRYVTTEYVGNTRIIDIDKAAVRSDDDAGKTRSKSKSAV